MTKEQALRHIEINLITLYDIDENVIECNDALEIIDKIYNDHETAIEILIKVNEEEISRHFNELKAKDEITQDIKEAYELKSIAYDLLLEAIQLKDEEIERLKKDKR